MQIAAPAGDLWPLFEMSGKAIAPAQQFISFILSTAAQPLPAAFYYHCIGFAMSDSQHAGDNL